MAPSPQENQCAWNNKSAEDRIIISGISGLYPKSKSVKDFSEVLYSKSNPITLQNSRWNYDHPDAVHYLGSVPGLTLFDAQFFKVHFRQGNVMDAMSRKLLEHTYQAIYDAGINPVTISGQKVGVYVGVCFSESDKALFYTSRIQTGFGISGCSKAMFANRISYWLNAKGPSISIDEGCTSSTCALELAQQGIIHGDCDMAIVGGCYLCLHPQSSIHHSKIIRACPDGKTKSFDENADGCAKSEAINVIFLQKAKDALRSYAEVVHVKCEFTGMHTEGTEPKFGFYRGIDNITTFIKSFYNEINVPMKAIEYVEAVGSAEPDADKVELEAIGSMYCKDRSDPLLVGSVMSNIGYTEAASGLTAITKVLLSYETGKIPSNLHCKSPRRDVAAIQEGKLRIVTDHTDFKRSYVAVNGRSITGVNTHVLLNGHYKPKVLSRYKCNMPQLVAVSGRQESAVEKIINDLKSKPLDPEELALLRNIHHSKVPGHLGRGYAILDTNESNETVCLKEEMDYYDDTVRPLWFVYSGMGSQWVGMGKHLLNIPVFAAAIEKCDRVLRPVGVDIYHIITTDDKTIFDNIQNSFVGIAAIQIGLTDILNELGIVPDKIIGHSVGELGCAYADGCFTAEEMVLAAYSRGKVSLETPLIHGAMAAIGLGYQQIIKMCPPEIAIACHNSSESCTISGPADDIRAFVKVLVVKGVFAKEVPCSNIAYHSRYIAQAGPSLFEFLKQVIKTPKLRSERWVSSSVPMDKWDEPSCKYSSAEYHTNNLLSPVLFEETSRLIPSNAILIEIAPHGLLQAILKRSFASCHNVPLTRRGHSNGVQFLLEAVGKLFMDGVNPKIHAIYPKVDFPVSTGTPPLSHLVEWVHEERWFLPLFITAQKKKASACKFVISTYDDDYNYITGYVIRGKNQFPFAASLLLVWDTYAMILEQKKRELSVKFWDVKFHSQPLVHDKEQMSLHVTIQRGTGRFEVINENIIVATGYISTDISCKTYMELEFRPGDDTAELSSEDIYQLFHTRDFSYSGEFQSLQSANLSLNEAKVIWNNNWVTFIDAILQLNALKCSHKMVSLPDSLAKMTIDVGEHEKALFEAKGSNVLTLKVSNNEDCTKCGGVVIEKIKYQNLSPLNETAISLKTLKFVPHFPTNNSDETTASYVYLQIASEKLNKQVLNIVEILSHKASASNYNTIKNIGNNIPAIKTEHSYVARENILEHSDKLNRADLILITNLSADENMCQTLHKLLKRDTLLVNKELYVAGLSYKRPSLLYRCVNAHIANDIRIELVIWRPSDSNGSCVYTVRSPSDLDYISSLVPTIPKNQKVYLLTTCPLVKGLKALVKQWRIEREVYLTMINHDTFDDKFLDDRLLNDLMTNIYENGVWGGEYLLPLEEKAIKQPNMMLKCSRPGDFDSVQWTEASEIGDNGINVQVHYAGINLAYVIQETGVIDACNTEGQREVKLDFSGVTKNGSRVMGITPDEVISTRVNAQPELLWPVPSHWSLEDAATVPLAYCLAFYCLNFKIQLQPKHHVLVHGGAGALGQALISIALALGCEVFVTVSNVHKKRFLKKLFPQLQDNHIGNSRDHTFGDMVLSLTNAEGCDVIVSCVQGELKNTTLKCCATSGVTIDVSQLPSREDFNLGMYNLTRCRSYITVKLSSIFDKENQNILVELQELISEGIARGYVKPLSRVTYSPQDAPRAFRLLAASRHRGRVLLDLRQHTLKVLPRLKCAADLEQVIISNDQELVMQLAEKLISRGAKTINIISKAIPNSLIYKKRFWEAEGVKINLAQGNTNVHNLVGLVNKNRSGAVEGIYYAAVSNEEVDNIDETTTKLRKLIPTLKYFAVIHTEYNVQQQIDINRSLEPLPVRIILPGYKVESNVVPSKGSMSSLNAAEAVERALCSEQPVVIASRRCPQRASLLQEIAKIADLTIEQDSEVTLQDIGINLSELETLRAYLWNEYSVSLPTHNISSLTLKTLQNLERKITEAQEFPDEDGLKSFFSHVDPDELEASCEIVFLPTQSKTSTTDGDYDRTQAYMCLVPGVEGHHERFREMCERLKMAALVLQPGLSSKQESIDDLAKRFAEVLINKVGIGNRFFLLGYESGVLIALKMAEILEANGLTGIVFCIGGSPEDIKAQFQNKLSAYKTKDDLQTAIIKHMAELLLINSGEQLNSKLQNARTWDEKVSSSLSTLKGKVPYSFQYAKEVIETAYAKVSQVLEYQPNVKQLRSKIIFIRSASSKSGTLQKYSQEPIIEYNLNTPFAYLTREPRSVVFVNRHLGDELLEIFAKLNLCETYYTPGASTHHDKNEIQIL